MLRSSIIAVQYYVTRSHNNAAKQHYLLNNIAAQPLYCSKILAAEQQPILGSNIMQLCCIIKSNIMLRSSIMYCNILQRSALQEQMNLNLRQH